MIRVRDNVEGITLDLHVRLALRVIVEIVTAIGTVVIHVCKYRRY